MIDRGRLGPTMTITFIEADLAVWGCFRVRSCPPLGQLLCLTRPAHSDYTCPHYVPLCRVYDTMCTPMCSRCVTLCALLPTLCIHTCTVCAHTDYTMCSTHVPILCCVTVCGTMHNPMYQCLWHSVPILTATHVPIMCLCVWHNDIMCNPLCKCWKWCTLPRYTSNSCNLLVRLYLANWTSSQASSYANLKLWLINPMSDRLTGVKCGATGLAKKTTS